MEYGNEQDLVIAGSGSSGGGRFRQVRIDGYGKLLSDIDCVEFGTNGKSEVRGSLQAEKASINGSVRIHGAVRISDTLEVNGETKIDGDAGFRQLKGKGSTTVGGSLNGEIVDVEGGINVEGDCEAETVIVQGGFRIGGLLSGGIIDVTMYWPCQAEEIGGEKIMVRRSGLKSFLNPFLPKFASKQLKADTIEGDEIYLEHTVAQTVRGNRITIGPGCVIQRVEYKHSMDRDKGAQINEIKQL
ncbi:bactofilin [Paenibacillus doosanensis]|uniref:bactofilin n=1 Tax=Paenibacillus doosanensis TaxID=1229154 RepID=UPI0021806352|nr:bactofilin [Paenibacillus doosanensis]MCS7462964.1 bactofilin [Paenibacillus doosanensis]